MHFNCHLRLASEGGQNKRPAIFRVRFVEMHILHLCINK